LISKFKASGREGDARELESALHGGSTSGEILSSVGALLVPLANEDADAKRALRLIDEVLGA
jgi:hypothetical protein